METVAFRMILNPGQADEYKRRHDEIWPELVAVLKRAGVSDYSIWLDAETHHLFALLKRPGTNGPETNGPETHGPETHGMDALAADPVVRRWWDAMADIMRVLPGNEPVQVPLVKMFHLA